MNDEEMNKFWFEQVQFNLFPFCNVSFCDRNSNPGDFFFIKILLMPPISNNDRSAQRIGYSIITLNVHQRVKRILHVNQHNGNFQ